MLYTTLNAIRAHGPCSNGWEKLLKSLGKTKADDKKLSLAAILKSNGIEDAIWCLRAVPDVDFFARRFALDCARRVEHLNTDPRVKECNDTTERFLAGKATKGKLAAAGAAARAAAWDAAWDAAGAAAKKWQSRHFAACLKAWPKSKWPVTK
jgi:hypothetical protein